MSTVYGNNDDQGKSPLKSHGETAKFNASLINSVTGWSVGQKVAER